MQFPPVGQTNAVLMQPLPLVATGSRSMTPAMAQLQAAMVVLKEAEDEANAEAQATKKKSEPLPQTGQTVHADLTPAMVALRAATHQAVGQNSEIQASPITQTVPIGMTPAMAALQAATQEAVGHTVEMQTQPRQAVASQGLTAGEGAVTPAKRALMQAMQDMNMEMSGMSTPEQNAVMQGWPGLHMQAQAGVVAPTQDLDSQQLQLLQMQRMQAAWLMANAGSASGPGTILDTRAAAPDPMLNPASIAASQAPELVTFGMGPSGPMDMSESAGGWRNPGGRDARVLTTDVSQPLIATQRVYTGIVKAFDAVKKSGFIQCDEIRQHMQQDVYVFQDVLARGNAGLADHVCFALHISGKGKLQASSPLCRLSTHSGYALSGVFQLIGAFKNLKNSEDSLGVIDCFDVKRVFGRGVRVPKDLGDKLHFGRRVAFNCTVDTEGICRAYNGETVSDDYAVIPGDLSQSWNYPGFDPQIFDSRHAGSNNMSVPAGFGVPGMGLSGFAAGADDDGSSAYAGTPAAFAFGRKGLQSFKAAMKVTGKDDGTGPWAAQQEANNDGIRRRIEELRALRDKMNEKRKEEGYEAFREDVKRPRAS